MPTGTPPRGTGHSGAGHNRTGHDGGGHDGADVRFDSTSLEHVLRAEERDLGIAVADPNQFQCPIIWVNARFLDRTGYVWEEVIGRDWTFLEGERTAPDALALIDSVVREGKALHIDLLHYRKGGETFWTRLHLRSIYDESLRLRYFLTTHQPIDPAEIRPSPIVTDERGTIRQKDGRMIWS